MEKCSFAVVNFMEKCNAMLYRKIESAITKHLTTSDKILVVTGARQIGKSYIIRHAANKIFKNVIEINLIEDYENQRLFEDISSVEDFYLKVSIIAGKKMGSKSDTLIFLDEIQQYPKLLTLLKFLREDGKFNYAVSGSLLGITLKATTSIPLGSIKIMRMYPLDFEEFLIANNVGEEAISEMRKRYSERRSLDKAVHDKIMELFKRYLLVGGLPDAVNTFIQTHNLVKIREIQRDIHSLYAIDASKYDNEHRLKISRIYEMIPSNMENKKKRLVYKDIEGVKGKRADNYIEEIDYLSSSGITLEVKAVSNPSFPLIESGQKNLLKLYINDIGIMTGLLYHNNIRPIIDDECSTNLGAVYECVAAMELAAHDHNLYYYDNKSKGEVDYLIDDFSTLSVVPLEIKSGKDYTVHSALNKFVATPDYNIKQAFVFSNEREIKTNGVITYLPIYYIMFVDGATISEAEILI